MAGLQGFDNITILNNKVGICNVVDYATQRIVDAYGERWLATLYVNGAAYHTGHGRKVSHAKDHAAHQYLFHHGYITIPPPP